MPAALAAPEAEEKPKTFCDRVQAFWVIDPRTNSWIAYWDLFTTIALIYTAVVTPYEVAFLQPPPPSERWSNELFLCNRVVDVIFIIDMFFQFRTAYKSTDHVAGTAWHTNPRQIAKHYVKSWWFYLDFFSIGTSSFDLVGDESMQDLIVLRAVRVLRLAKLVRLVRGSRIFKKWEMTMSINYAYLGLFQVTTGVILGCHWFACLWGLEASLQPNNSWPWAKEYCVPFESDNRSFVESAVEACTGGRNCAVGTCSGDYCTGGFECVEPWSMYSYALYFAVMTITSVGYGDIVATALNVNEQMICSFIILSSGMLWGYLIGTFCGLAAATSPQQVLFREELSSLNTWMSENHLPADMRFRLREYIFEAVHLNDSEVRKKILAKLSPSMQLEVSWQVNARWVHMVWYLSDPAIVPERLIIDLAMCLKALVFPPRELAPAGFLYILERGSALWAGKMQRAGMVWGEDVVLQNDEIQLNLPALCATYVCTYIINAEALLGAIDKYPTFKEAFRLIRLKWTVRRCIVRMAEKEMHGRGKPFRGRLRPIYAKDLAAEIDRAQKMRSLSGPASGGETTPGLPKSRRATMMPQTPAPAEQLATPPKRLAMTPSKRTVSHEDTREHKNLVKRVEVATLEGGIELRVNEMRGERRNSSEEPAAVSSRLGALESKLEGIEQLLVAALGGRGGVPSLLPSGSAEPGLSTAAEAGLQSHSHSPVLVDKAPTSGGASYVVEDSGLSPAMPVAATPPAATTKPKANLSA